MTRTAEDVLKDAEKVLMFLGVEEQDECEPCYTGKYVNELLETRHILIAELAAKLRESEEEVARGSKAMCFYEDKLCEALPPKEN